MIPSTLAVLIRARAIIADPKHWHQGYFHNDDDTAFCSLGAINRAYDQLGNTESIGMHTPAREVLNRVVGAQYPQYIGRNMPEASALAKLADPDGVYIAQWNDADERLHEQVVEMFDAAIELASARQDPI